MRNPFLKSSWFFVAVFTIAISLFLSACSTEKTDVANMGTPTQAPTFAKLSASDPEVQAVMEVQNKHTAKLMADKNVVGTATGLTADGKIAVLVFLEKGDATPKGVKAISSIPADLDGVPVVVEVTGAFKAMKTTAVSHKAKQTPPIQLGTSGGWRYDLANGYCCGGTLGSLIQKGGTQYVLSNYHVLWGDIVAGGNSRVATAGDPVIQPGLIDVGCNAANAQNVANLSGAGSLPSANVDAGYAQVISGMVRTDGAILEVGTISATTVAAYVGQPVKKSGRTSGLTRTTVSGLNGTVSIQYETECAGTAAFVKTFTGQVILKGGKFIQSGDSGSLMVEDITTNPHAVGLCFAGSATNGIANPINAVLSWAGATMVGQ
jgi:hypothetical protein